MIEFALRQYLLTVTAITTQVTDQIYPLRTPINKLGDKITYRRKSGTRNYVLTGGTGISHGEFEIACWSQSYDAAKTLAKNVRLALHGFMNNTWGSGATLTTVGVVQHIDEEDAFSDPEEGSDDGWFMVLSTFKITYQETPPTF